MAPIRGKVTTTHIITFEQELAALRGQQAVVVTVLTISNLLGQLDNTGFFATIYAQFANGDTVFSFRRRCVDKGVFE